MIKTSYTITEKVTESYILRNHENEVPFLFKLRPHYLLQQLPQEI